MSFSQQQTLEASAAVAWSIWMADSFDVDRIDLHWESAVLTAEVMTITKDAAAGAAYDTVLYADTIPAGATDVSYPGVGGPALTGFVPGDKLVVSFANTDTIAIKGTATVSY